MRTWLVDKQIFMEPISNGYFGPRESIGYITGLNLNHTFRSALIGKLDAILDSTELAAQAEMDSSTPSQPNSPPVLLPSRTIELIRTRLHVNTTKHCYANAFTIVVPRGHGQSTTDTLMKAYTLNLHKSLPGKFIAKGMIGDSNKNFIKECILQQNKINWKFKHKLETGQVIPSGCDVKFFTWKFLMGLVLLSIGGQVY